VIHLAHLSQVDCQFVSRPKPFQNNNLQFDAGLFGSHLAHFVHTQAKEIVEKRANWAHQDALDNVVKTPSIAFEMVLSRDCL